MGALGVLVLCCALSAALSAELRSLYAALLRATFAALFGALRRDGGAGRDAHDDAVAVSPAPQGGKAAAAAVLRDPAAFEAAPSPAARPARPAPCAPPSGAVASWSVADVGAWLRSIELGEHAAAFAAAAVDGALLLQLTPDELLSLGVTAPLHAKKIRLRLLLATAAASQTPSTPPGAARNGVAAATAAVAASKQQPWPLRPLPNGAGDAPAGAEAAPAACAPSPCAPPSPLLSPLAVATAVAPPAPGGPTRRESLLSAAAEPDPSPRSGVGSERASSLLRSSDAAPASRCCEGALGGHAGWVTALAFLPDGRMLSGSEDATVRVWAAPPRCFGGAAATSAECDTLLEGHAGAVRALTPLRDAPPGCFASASDDATLRVWSLGDADPCRSGGADGTEVADAAARLPADALPPRCCGVLSGHADAVYALAALPRGALLSGAMDRTLRLWCRADSGGGGYACAAVLDGHKDFVLALALLPAPLRALSASWDGTLRVWSLGDTDADVADVAAAAAPRCLTTLRGHSGPVRAVAALPCGTRCASGGADASLRVWHVSSGVCELVVPLTPPPSSSRSGATREAAAVLALAALSARRIAVASDDGSLRVWTLPRAGDDAATPPARSMALRGHTKKVYALAAALAGSGGASASEAGPVVRLASGSRDRSVRVWALPRDEDDDDADAQR